MNKKIYLLVVILLAVFISGCSLRSTTEKTTTSILKKTPPKLLLKSCCASGEKWCKQSSNKEYKVCPDDYEKKCKNRGGSLHSSVYLGNGIETFSCYKSAPDVGKACANDSECVHTCDLNNGIIKNLCNLKNTEKNENLTTETYDCSTDMPGVCSPVPIEYNVDCGGSKFELNGKNLKIEFNNNSC